MNPKGVVDGKQVNIPVPAHKESDGVNYWVRTDGIVRWSRKMIVHKGYGWRDNLKV